MKRLKEKIALGLAALLMACMPAVRAAGVATYADLWWIPAEPGWGAQIVQQGDIAFVTLFVHRADGKPEWLVAPNAALYAVGADGRPAFGGPLYRVEGPWIGIPFDATRVRAQSVGRLTLEPTAEGRLHLDYDVDGIHVSKRIERQTFSSPAVFGEYTGVFRMRASAVGSPVVRYEAEVSVRIEDGAAALRVDEPGSRCHYVGFHVASGRLGRITGQYSCLGGAEGPFTITDLEITAHGVSGLLRKTGPMEGAGRFALLAH
jgi:hypothetical protein